MDTLYLVTMILMIVYGISIYPVWKGKPIMLYGIIIIFSLALFYVIFHKINVVEHLQISGEAVQNVGSIYNSNEMKVGKLEASNTIKSSNGVLELSQGWSILTNDSGFHVMKDGQERIAVRPNGETEVKGKLTCNNLYSYDWIHSDKGGIRSQNGALYLGGNDNWQIDAGDGNLKFNKAFNNKLMIGNDGTSTFNGGSTFNGKITNNSGLMTMKDVNNKYWEFNSLYGKVAIYPPSGGWKILAQ